MHSQEIVVWSKLFSAFLLVIVDHPEELMPVSSYFSVPYPNPEKLGFDEVQSSTSIQVYQKAHSSKLSL